MNKSIIAYFVFSILSLIFQTILLIYFSKSKSQYKKFLMPCMILSILILIVYSFFILTTNLLFAKICKSLFYISLDLISLYMLNFSEVYIYFKKQNLRHKLNIVMIFSILFDAFLNILNFYKPIMFDLISVTINNGHYWKMKYYGMQNLHFIFVYSLLLSSFLNFLVGYIKNPIQYKNRYLGIMLAYFCVIFANAISFSINAQYDISVFLYGYLIDFIYYFSTYIIPHNLLIQSLQNLNSTVDESIIYFNNKGKIVYINNSAKDTFIENNVFTYESLEEFRKEKINQHKGNLDNIKLTWNEDFVIYGDSRHLYFEYEDVIYDNVNIGSYFVISDKTDEINKLQREKYLSSHDLLTNIYNEQYFYEKADELIANSPEVPRYIITSNICDFKLINELFGQEFGNKVLIKFADVLQKSFGDKKSIYGRLNDDKFVLLIEKVNFHETFFLSQIDHVKSLFENNYNQIHINFGICEVNNYESAEILVKKSKIAIEMGKNNYQETFFYYDSIVMEKILAEKNILNEFKDALIKKQIQIDYQPIVNADGQIKGVEALSRWNNPKRGLLNPEKFIPILENNSIIQNLDLYVWENVAKKLSDWNKSGQEIPFISVNISDKDVYYIDLYNVFTKIAQEYNIPPNKMILEFKESSIVTNVDNISKLFQDLREFGFKIAIDNYGTGYSSLNFLKNIQIDILKIDMIFLSQNEVFERSKLILNFLFQMSKELGITLIFEGLETLDQYKLIKSFGDVLIQGNYFYNPLKTIDLESKINLVQTITL